jgi:hypothetical protein
VQKPTQELQSIIEPDNTYDWNPQVGKNFSVLNILFMGYL